MYRELKADRIVETAEALALRIAERFPASGLSRLASELADVSRQAAERCREIRRPHRGYRFLAAIGVVLLLLAMAFIVRNLKATGEMWHVENLISEVNDLLGTIVFLGAAVIFMLSLESRSKRTKALDAMAELRALAHIVDMHQLTKDPEFILGRGKPTSHSPRRNLSPFELNRYFDYCTECLSLISKVGALYIQAFQDPVALSAADDLEELCTGLSRKIWQKILVLDRLTSRLSAPEAATAVKLD